jgi:hypothetical protein
MRRATLTEMPRFATLQDFLGKATGGDRPPPANRP